MKTTARLFKALADETRLRILALLTHGELCVCDLTAVLELPQSTVSRHLAYLRNAGWVDDRRQGVWMYYCLADADHPLQQQLLPLLADGLSGTAETAQDLAALESYLAERSHRCG